MLRAYAFPAFVLCACFAHAQQFTISTIAGTGTAGSTGNGAAAISATVYYPQGVTLAVDGSLYFGQPTDHTIRKIDSATGNMVHVAGTGTVGYGGNGGPAVDAGLAYPFGLSFTADGDLLIAERDAFRIRRISGADGTISTFAGTTSPGSNTEVPALAASLHAPMAVRMRANGDVLLSVIGNNYVRYVDADSVYLHAFAGNGIAAFAGDNGPAIAASFNLPYDIAIAQNGDVYIADINNGCVRKVDAVTGIITTMAGIGNGPAAYNGDGIAATSATLGLPMGIALDAGGNLFICDAQQSRIRRVDAGTGIISTVAGTSTSGYNGDNINSTSAQINAPCGIVIDAQGRIFFADAANHRIRMLTPIVGTSVEEAQRVSLMVWPSPAWDVIHVRSAAKGLMELLDQQGRVVRTASKTSDAVSLPVHGLAQGLYTIRMQGAVPMRVVVE